MQRLSETRYDAAVGFPRRQDGGPGVVVSTQPALHARFQGSVPCLGFERCKKFSAPFTQKLNIVGILHVRPQTTSAGFFNPVSGGPKTPFTTSTASIHFPVRALLPSGPRDFASIGYIYIFVAFIKQFWVFLHPINQWCNYYQYTSCFMVFLSYLRFVYNILRTSALRLEKCDGIRLMIA